MLFDARQYYCHFSTSFGSFRNQRAKLLQGTLLFINLLGKGLTSRACIEGGDSIWWATGWADISSQLLCKKCELFFLFSRFTTSPSSFQPLSSYSFAGYQPRFPPPSSAPPIPPSLSSLNSPLSQYAPPSVSSPVTAMSHSPANAQVSLIFVFLLRFCFKLRFLVGGKSKIPDVEEALNLIFGSPLTRSFACFSRGITRVNKMQPV